MLFQYHHCWAKCAPRNSKEVCACVCVCICLRWSCQMLIWKTTRSNEHGIKQKQCPSINWLLCNGMHSMRRCEWDKMPSKLLTCLVTCRQNTILGCVFFVLLAVRAHGHCSGRQTGNKTCTTKAFNSVRRMQLSKSISRNCWIQMLDSIPCTLSCDRITNMRRKLLLCSSVPFWFCFFFCYHDAIESEPTPRKKETSKWHKQQRL